VLAAAGLIAGIFPAADARAAEGELIGYLPFSTVAPQDFAFDSSDGSYWITAFLDQKIYHFSAGLGAELESFAAPIPYPTGIVVNSNAGTILVTGILSDRIVELEKNGSPTGREILPELLPVVNPNSAPSPRGMAFDAGGDGGLGSIYLVEGLGTLIYEIALDGRVIRSFSHPDDPDGYPGRGQTAPTSDIELIYENGSIAGFYVTGGRSRLSHIRRLDASGAYTGIAIPLEDAGGNVSGILRRPFAMPGPGSPEDSFICVVEAPPRFAILKGGEPDLREVLDFAYTSSGHSVEMTWRSPQLYDRFEVVRGCEVIETLPGTATSWSRTFETEGIYELTLRAYRGGIFTSPPTALAVLGPGEVLRSESTGGLQPMDIASAGGGILLATEAYERRILVYDSSFQALPPLELDEAIAESGDALTGIAHAADTGIIYLMNATRSRVEKLDETGAHLGSFDALLPNLEEDPLADPDLGFVLGMAYDPVGDAGRGSLWVVESVRDRIYELDLGGNVILSFTHPYLGIEPPPQGYGIYTSGIAVAPPSGGRRELLLGGGALRDQSQPHIFRVDAETGEVVPGSVITTLGIRRASTNGFFTFDVFDDGAETRLAVLTIAGRTSKLLELSLDTAPVPAPTFLTARQADYRDAATLSFTPNAAYDRVEIFRDCEPIGDVPGPADSYVDTSPAPGVHEYAVRGILGGRASDFVRARVRIGPGAVLQRAFLVPARSPQQLTRDPQSGEFLVSVNWPGDERKVYHYDRSFRYLKTRESVVDPQWQIAALAVRRAPAEPGEIAYITWQLPVPIGDVASQKFFLVKESMEGGFLGMEEIHPPRPTNGFITFPTGLAWDARRDSFFFLERNSKTFVEMSPEGEILGTFPHPSPPFQNFIFNLGVSVVPERSSIFITGSDRTDHRVTRVLEMTDGGALTGLVIPADSLGGTITGITMVGGDLVAVGTGSMAEIFRIKALSGEGPAFVRGDADGNLAVNLTDAIYILNHLFLGGTVPVCDDAADVDDSGITDIADAVNLLLHLFQSGAAPPSPYPDPGADPTADALTCFHAG